jgi:hypothetical protein
MRFGPRHAALAFRSMAPERVRPPDWPIRAASSMVQWVMAFGWQAIATRPAVLREIEPNLGQIRS